MGDKEGSDEFLHVARGRAELEVREAPRDLGELPLHALRKQGGRRAEKGTVAEFFPS
jgi:hypothetical protein